MNTTTTTAAREAAKNLSIYKAVAEVAAAAFELLTIEPGEYTAPQVVAALTKSPTRAQWNDKATATVETITDEGTKSETLTADDWRLTTARVEVEGFACSFLRGDAFALLARLATAYEIPTRERATFAREAESAPAVCSFQVPTAAAAVVKAVAKKDPQRPAFEFAYFDTTRRALVGCDAYTLTVCAAPFAEVSESARPGYLVARELLKSGRVTIDTNNKATNGTKCAESPDWLRFPNWAAVFPQVFDTDAVKLDKATARALTKAVAAATKYAESETDARGDVTKFVAIIGEACTDRLTVRARRRLAAADEVETGNKWEYFDTAVKLADTLARSFVFAFHGPRFATLPTFETIFTPADRPAVFVSAHSVSLLTRATLRDDFDTITKADTTRPAFAVELHPLADLLTVFEDAPTTGTKAETITPDPVAPADTENEATTPAESVETIETPQPTAEAVSEAENERETPQADELAPAAEVETITTDETPAEDYDPDHLTPADRERIAAECAEAIERENETPAAVAARPDWLTTGRAVAYWDHDRRAYLVGTIEAPRYLSSFDEWAADFHHGAVSIIGVSAGELHPAPADPFELTADVVKAMKTAAKAYTDRPTPENEYHRALTTLHAAGLRLAGEWFTLRATGEVVAKVVKSYGKKRRDLSCPCTAARVELLTYPDPDTITPTREAETITTDETPDTLAEVVAVVERERERLAAAGELLTDTDPAAPAFEAGEAFEYITDKGTTTPARVRSLYYNNFDENEAPRWVYCFDCEPFADRHGVTIDGGSCDALRMKKTTAAVVEVETITTTDETPQADELAPVAEVETITPAPAADTIETPAAVSETPANVWALADELPTADGLTADTVTPADLLTIESERAARPVFVAVSVERAAAPADTPQADREAVSEAENERESRRALLLTIASRARRLAVAVAAVVVAALLLTITPDRPTTGTAAPAAADLLAPVAVADTIESADTLTREALTLTPDTVATVFEAVSVERAAAPADTRPTVRERHHAPRIKRESRRPDLLAVELAPDTVSETPDTLAALLLTIESADTLTASPADTIETADTLTREADTLTVADSLTIESDTADPDPVSEADGDPQADPLTPSPAGTTGTPSPLTLTPSPSPLPVVPVYGMFSPSFLML